MRRRLTTVLMGLGIAMAVTVHAADSGRYQAISLDGDAASRSGSRVLIIDSQEGHVWTWSGNELISGSDGERRYGAAFIYQGKVRPGNKAGDYSGSQSR